MRLIDSVQPSCSYLSVYYTVHRSVLNCVSFNFNSVNKLFRANVGESIIAAYGAQRRKYSTNSRHSGVYCQEALSYCFNIHK